MRQRVLTIESNAFDAVFFLLFRCLLCTCLLCVFSLEIKSNIKWVLTKYIDWEQNNIVFLIIITELPLAFLWGRIRAPTYREM